MKKTIAILLVAVLAVGSLFAGLSGEASVTAGVDLDKEEWGFFGNGTNVKFDLSLGKEDVEKAAEGEVYASIKASLEAKIANSPYDGEEKVIVHDKDVEKSGYNVPVRVRASVSEAKVFGSNWYVSILGVPGGPDFAKSAIDTVVDKAKGSKDDWGFKIDETTYKAKSYSAPYDKAPGLEAGYADYVAGFGLNTLKNDTAFAAYLKTPEFAFEGVTVQGAVVASKKAASKAYNYGASAKAGYATDLLAATLAADMGLTFEEKKDAKFNMDLAANFKYDFVTVDAYLNTADATEAKDGTVSPDPEDWGAVALPVWLSAKVATDLNSFDVPVKLEVTGKDLLAKIDLGAKVTVSAIENLELTVSGGYIVNTVGRDAGLMYLYKDASEKPFVGQWSAKVGAKYTASFATISGEVSMKNWGFADAYKNVFKAQMLEPLATEAEKELSNDYLTSYEITDRSIDSINKLSNRLVFGAKVSVENTTLIPGATLKLGWEGKDLANKYKIEQKGKIAASCTIKF